MGDERRSARARSENPGADVRNRVYLVYLVLGRAERWVSQGRYFCKYCRVWFADNKSVRTRRGLSARGSAQVPEDVVELGSEQGHAVHERGEKHREAVAKFLDDTEKRGVANEKKQHSLAKQMSEIEKARRRVRALKADEGPC